MSAVLAHALERAVPERAQRLGWHVRTWDGDSIVLPAEQVARLVGRIDKAHRDARTRLDTERDDAKVKLLGSVLRELRELRAEVSTGRIQARPNRSHRVSRMLVDLWPDLADRDGLQGALAVEAEYLSL